MIPFPFSSRRSIRILAATGVLQLLLVAAAAAQSPEVPDMQPMRRLFLQSEVLEYAPGGVDNPIRYDLLGWIGADVNRVWLKADGEHGTGAGGGETELQALYGKLIAPYWDAQVGVRFDAHYGEEETATRAFLALGLQGLAPYWFELEPAVFLSQHGDLSASLTASYELLFTQRLIVEPRVEASAALQEVEDFGVGRGLNDIEFGLRARYELRREFAPYVGFVWARRVGGTADLAHAAGEPVREFSFVLGLRMWR